MSQGRNDSGVYKPDTIQNFNRFLKETTDGSLIKVLDLSELGGLVEARHLEKASRKFSNLTELNVSGCHLYPQSRLGQEVSSGLTSLIRSNPNLTNLDVSFCWEVDDSLAKEVRKTNIAQLNVQSCFGLESHAGLGRSEGLAANLRELQEALPGAKIVGVDGGELPMLFTSKLRSAKRPLESGASHAEEYLAKKSGERGK